MTYLPLAICSTSAVDQGAQKSRPCRTMHPSRLLQCAIARSGSDGIYFSSNAILDVYRPVETQCFRVEYILLVLSPATETT